MELKKKIRFVLYDSVPYELYLNIRGKGKQLHTRARP